MRSIMQRFVPAASSQWFRRIARIAALAWLGACTGGGDGATPPTQNNPQPGSITLSLSVASGTVTQGSSTTVNAVIARSGSFTGAVDVTIENLPAGVTAAASPSTLGAGVTSTTITVTVGAGATAATTSLTVRAKGSGVTDQ